MALSYVIDHADQRVIVRMAGTFSNQEIDACYARLFADAQFVPGFDLLLDLRAPQVAPSAQEIRDRAKRSGAHKSCFSGRVAMVFPWLMPPMAWDGCIRCSPWNRASLSKPSSTSAKPKPG